MPGNVPEGLDVGVGHVLGCEEQELGWGELSDAGVFGDTMARKVDLRLCYELRHTYEQISAAVVYCQNNKGCSDEEDLWLVNVGSDPDVE